MVLSLKSRAVKPFHVVAHIRDKKNSNLGSLGLAQTILLLKDLGVLLEVLLDHLREAEGKDTINHVLLPQPNSDDGYQSTMINLSCMATAYKWRKHTNLRQLSKTTAG